MTFEILAPAKINLTLHITGRRSDGYHLLDSLVVFADIGDRLRIGLAERLALTADGPFAADLPAPADNIVTRAWASVAPGRGAAIHLEKRLPVASGIGGGSSCAAAAIRGAMRLYGLAAPDAAGLADLGADVPVCLDPRPQRMQGTGEVLAPVPVPDLHIVLANPGRALSTGAVFAGLAGASGAAMSADLPRWRDGATLAAWLAGQRNDLQPVAEALVPEIAGLVRAMAASRGCLLSRMSGSGATVFGLYASAASARAAAAALAAPGRWVAAGRLLSAVS